MKAQELENRLIDFAVTIVGIVEALPETKAGNPIGGQLILHSAVEPLINTDKH